MTAYLGFGNVGKELALSFDTYGIFDEKVVVDTESFADSILFDVNMIQIPLQKRSVGVFPHEKYDAQNYDKQGKKIRKLIKSDIVYVVVSGGSDISGAVLSFMEFLSDKQIHIIYIKPEEQHLQSHIALQERVTRGVLQENARSGRFERIFLFDNQNISAIIGDVPVKQYYKRINDTISYMVYTLLFCEAHTPVFSAQAMEEEFYKIIVLGVMNQGGDEALAYDYNPIRPKAPEGGYDELQFPTTKNYHYLISNNKLDTDPEIMNNVKRQVDNKEMFLTSIGYMLYDSDLEEDQILIKLSSGLPQV